MAKDRLSFVENVVRPLDLRSMRLLHPDFMKSSQGLLPVTQRVQPVPRQNLHTTWPPGAPTFTAAVLARLPKNFDILHFVLNCLKAIGQAPFGCNGKEYKRYYFICPSFDTGCCLVVALLVTFNLFVYTSHLLFKKFWVFPPGIRYTITFLEELLIKESGSDTTKAEAHILSLSLLNGSIAATVLSNVLHGWLDRHTLINLMNRWTEMRQAARKFLMPASVKMKTSTYYVVTLLGAFAGLSGMCYAILIIWLGTPPHPDRVLEATFISLIMGYYGLCETLHDLKVGFMFYELSANFRQVQKDIVHAFERKVVSEEKIQAWRQTVLLVREQASLVSSYLAFPQLMLLLQSIILGTIAIFLALNAFSKNVAGTAEITSSLFVWLLLRVLVKATLAEQITAEEASIADELIRRNFRGALSTEIQLKELTFLLVMSPTQINFANIVTLRKYLCLTIITQIVSYLIVLIQFYN